jgi:mono/diheme cytochrome c family protein
MAMRVRTVVYAVLTLVVVLLLGAITAVGWQVVFGPDVRPATDRTFEVTEARLERGRYLAEGPAACFHCHTEHDLSQPEYPILQDRKGAGWAMPIPELGSVIAPNVTSDPETGIGAWTDDEVARAIQEGVSRDGTALFPIMPYLTFAQLDPEDLASIVVYLRTLPPVRQVRARSELIFPLNLLVKTIPVPLHEPRPPHPSGTPVERGAYLALVAQCGECHTPAVQGEPLPGMAFGGGGVFSDPGNDMRPVFSINITPDPSGIAHYDADLFLQVIRSGQLPSRTLSHIMPFEFFRNMTDADLGDLFAYLQSLTPVKHRVSNDDPPTPCAVCGQEHGLGELNRAQ